MHAVQVLHLVQQYDFPIWKALGTCLLGMADAQLGRPDEGLAPRMPTWRTGSTRRTTLREASAQE